LHVGSGADPGVEVHRGARRPRIHGWVSPGYLKYEPAPALGFSARGAGDFVAATLFELAGPDAPPRLELSRGATGRITLSDGPGTARSFAVGPCDLDLSLTLL
jgi:hypothetical protein